MGGYGTGSGRACKAAASSSRIFCRRLRCQRATGLGQIDLAAGRRDVQVEDVGGVAAQRREVRLERPDVAAGHRPGQRRADPERPGVAQRPLDQRAVDRQRTGLVEAGHPAELGDRVEQRDEPTGGQDGRGVVGRLRAGREADRRRADRLGHVGQHRRQLVVALDGDRRAVERRDRPFRVGEGDQRMEGADLGPGRHRRGEDLRPERAAGVDHRLAAVHPERAGQRRARRRRGRPG